MRIFQWGRATAVLSKRPRMKNEALENNRASKRTGNSHYHRGGSGIGLATQGSPPSTTRRSRCCRDEGCPAKAPSWHARGRLEFSGAGRGGQELITYE